MAKKRSSRRDCLQPAATATRTEMNDGNRSSLPANDTTDSTRAAQSATSHGYSAKQIDRAKLTVHRAEIWRLENRDAYMAVVAHVLDLAARGERASTRDYLSVVHSKAYADQYGRDATINADFCPVIARWLWTEHPEIRRHIQLRRCPVGVVMGV